jgi:purine-binding chemotaxis protein CheW
MIDVPALLKLSKNNMSHHMMKEIKPLDQTKHANIPYQGECQILSFLLNDIEYGIDISYVKEIIASKKITKLPNSPSFIRGVVNLRGNIVPVVDLKRRFQLVETINDTERSIITILLKINEKMKCIGMLTDKILDTYLVNQDEISPIPLNSSAIFKRHVYGVVAIDEKPLMLLNTQELFCETID